MDKINYQSLNALFTYLVKDTQNVIWIRSPDYKRQLYLTPSFEQIWQRPCQILYENPSNFVDYLIVGNHYDTIISQLGARRIDSSQIPTDTVFYQIHRPDESVAYIRDKSFFIVEQDQIIAIAGISESITSQQWDDAYINPVKNKSIVADSLQSELNQIFNNEFHYRVKAISKQIPDITDLNTTTLMVNKKSVRFTAREIQCLACLLRGMSAKTTARFLAISARTVEHHLENIRDKTNCRSKYEIASQISIKQLMESAQKVS